MRLPARSVAGPPHPSATAATLGMPMRRIRASFLLRCVILAFCAALLSGVVLLGMETRWTIATLAVAAFMWFAAIEFGILPHLIERAAVRRAARSGKPVSSI